MYGGFPDTFQIEKEVKSTLKNNEKELSSARRELEIALIKKGYLPRGVCSLCSETYPDMSRLLEEGKDDKVEISMQKISDPKKFVKKVKKAFKNLHGGGVICRSYTKPKIFGKPTEVFILTQEYCVRMLAGQIINSLMIPNSPNKIIRNSLPFYLGPMNCYAFGESQRDQQYFNDRCRGNLRITSDASIARFDESQIK